MDKCGMIVYMWAVSGKLFLQQEEHRLLMDDWKHCIGFVAKMNIILTRVFHTCRSCMTLHTSWPLSCWLWISPGSSSTCRSIQARDRGFVRCLKMGYTSENILKYISRNRIFFKKNAMIHWSIQAQEGPYVQTKPYCLFSSKLDFCFAFSVFWFGIQANNAHEQERWCPVDREQGRVTLQFCRLFFRWCLLGFESH